MAKKQTSIEEVQAEANAMGATLVPKQKDSMQREYGSEVLIAHLHDNLFIPGVGDFGRTIHVDPKLAKFKDLRMWWNGHCIDWQYRLIANEIMCGFIPGPNIVSGILKK